MNAILARAAALAVVAVLVVAQPPCDTGYTYYPDLMGTEEAARLPDPRPSGETSLPRFSGSCLRLHKVSDAFFPKPSKYKSFAVAARSFCGFSHAGGRLLSFSSTSADSHAILAVVKSLTANASTPYVLTGGVQNPKALGLPKHQNWIWTDADTNPGVINVDPTSPLSNWGPGQPECVRSCG